MLMCTRPWCTHKSTVLRYSITFVEKIDPSKAGINIMSIIIFKARNKLNNLFIMFKGQA